MPRPHARQTVGIWMTLLTAERLVWHCGDHTAKPESASRGRFLLPNLLFSVARGSKGRGDQQAREPGPWLAHTWFCLHTTQLCSRILARSGWTWIGFNSAASRTCGSRPSPTSRSSCSPSCRSATWSWRCRRRRRRRCTRHTHGHVRQRHASWGFGRLGSCPSLRWGAA